MAGGIASLALAGWRNLAPLHWQPQARFTVLHGCNGAGKTSLLEAIAYLSKLRSFRGARADELIQVGCAQADLALQVQAEPLPQNMRVCLQQGGGRRLLLDGKRPAAFAAWRPVLPTVLFHPGHLQLAAGSAEGRRQLLDGLLEATDVAYAKALQAYQQALRSRNALLRQGQLSEQARRVYDALLVQHGEPLMKTRSALVDALAALVVQAHSQVAGHRDGPKDGGQAGLQVRYASRTHGDADRFASLLRASAEKDKRLRYTSEGPHTDDVELRLDGMDVRRQASQGQQRAIVLAIKLAEMRWLADAGQRLPVLLLDDVSSELDAGVSQRFFSQMAETASQVLIATTDPQLIPLPAQGRQDVGIAQGRLLLG